MKKTWLYRLRALLGRLLCSLLPYSRAAQQTRFVVRMRTHRVPAELAHRWFDYLESRVLAPRGDLETALRVVSAIYAREAVYFRDLVDLSMYLGDDVNFGPWLTHHTARSDDADLRDPRFFVPRSRLPDFMRDFPLRGGISHG